MIYLAETANLSTISEKGCIISLTTINPNFDKACVLIEPIVFFFMRKILTLLMMMFVITIPFSKFL